MCSDKDLQVTNDLARHLIVPLHRTVSGAAQPGEKPMSDKTPSQRAQDWLSGFEQAMRQGQAAQAAALFDTDCYWRDLVSFTWNIGT